MFNGLDHMSEIFYLPLQEKAVLDNKSYSSLLEARKDLFGIEDMILSLLRIYDHIIEVDKTCIPFEIGGNDM